MPDLNIFEKDTINRFEAIYKELMEGSHWMNSDQIAPLLTVASILKGIWKELNDIKRSLEQKV